MKLIFCMLRYFYSTILECLYKKMVTVKFYQSRGYWKIFWEVGEFAIIDKLKLVYLFITFKRFLPNENSQLVLYSGNCCDRNKTFDLGICFICITKLRTQNSMFYHSRTLVLHSSYILNKFG